MKPYSSFSTKQTPQSEPIPGQTQVQNNAGGFVYALDKWAQLDRFLILGSEGGTYYVKEQSLTKENALVTIACIKEDGIRAVKRIVEISDRGLAPKNDPAIFALALAVSADDTKTRQYAMANLSNVCRIPTHLMHFADFCKSLRGWGSILKNGVANWYQEQELDKLAYQLVKYQQRDGWANADLLRKAHPPRKDDDRNALYRWVLGKDLGPQVVKDKSGKVLREYPAINAKLPEIVQAFEDLKAEFKEGNGQPNTQAVVNAILKYNLSREMLPTEALTKPEVWEALLVRMPYTAMLRNLGNMSKVGLLKPLSGAEKLVADRLTKVELIQKGRVHPVALLMALKTYGQGHGLKGAGTWATSTKVVDALNDAFYLSFTTLEPTGKRFLLGVDVSGSMSSACAGTPLSCAEGAAAMALSIAKVEQNSFVHGFTSGASNYGTWYTRGNQDLSGFINLGISPKMRLDDALARTRNQNFGATDCALPMLWALKNKVEVDCFIVITDNETWAGNIHPSQALKQYRQQTGIQAREIVIGMTSTGFSIADPSDPLTLDVVGFSADVPSVVSNFNR